MTYVTSTKPRGSWWERACPTCGGDAYLDPTRGEGLMTRALWVCLLCGRTIAPPLAEPALQAALFERGAA